MELFEIEHTKITGEVKKQLESFIVHAKCISPEIKRQLRDELGSNWSDSRFSAIEFIEACNSWAYFQWQQESLKEVELWKDVVIKNASTNNEPHLVANEVIKEFNKQFHREEL